MCHGKIAQCARMRFAAGQAIHRRRHAEAAGKDRPSSWLRPFRYSETMRSKLSEALVRLVKKVLGHCDVHQRRMDIAVSKIRRKERQLVLRIDAGAVPFENAVHHE